MKAIKETIQEYWSSLSLDDRRDILGYIVTRHKLPLNHPILKEDDIPSECARVWLEQVIAKEDWGEEYSEKKVECI